MPRTSVRSQRPSAAKSRAPSTGSAPEETASTSLRVKVCEIFSQVQRSNTGHRKLVISLRKLQESCCYEPASTKPSASQEDFDEGDFNEEISRCLLRILSIKKSEPVGDRIIRFLGLFLKHATEADNTIFRDGEEADEEQGLPETPSTRLTSHIVSMLLPLLTAKDKVVRFRCTQIVAHIVNTLDSVDDELFHHIRLGMMRRLRDKESSVRVQAVYGLGRLAGEGETAEDDEDSDDDVAGGVLEKLLEVLQNDPSAEVRRALLLNLPFSPTTLPYLLERARDLDAGIRRALYSRLLPALGDFRHLSLTHREKLLRWGLRDRDENVQKATARLFRERWIEDCARPQDSAEDPKPGEVSAPSEEGLRELLERIDVSSSGNDGGIALDAMKQFWDGRPDYRDYIQFDDAFWKDLTPEAAFIARTFNDYCHQDGAPDSLQDKIPEVTKFAFLLQQQMNKLVELVQNSAMQEEAEEDTIQQEFIVEQLLQIALTLDFSDEVGRRTMFSLMRGALSLADIPEETTKLIVDVLRIACGSSPVAEREFCGVVLEAITDVHDTIMGDTEEMKPDEADDSFHSARSEISDDVTPRKKTPEEEAADQEKAVREIMVNMKCLHIAQCMLQNVECIIEQNTHLVTLLNSLVVPAVRSQEAPIRERGLLCLGLCCLLDKNLAEENLSLFLHCFTKGHEALQNIAVQIIGDVMATHPSFLISQQSTNEEDEPAENPLQKPLQKAFSKGLKSPSPAVQTTTCTALCKLMLSSPAMSAGAGSILNVNELLKILVVAYFDPETTSNPALRQALSYFIPVYCHSSQQHMTALGSVAVNILQACFGMKEEMDVEGEDDPSGNMVGLNVVVAHLVDWTDGRKLAVATKTSGLEEEVVKEASCETHVELASQLLEKLLTTSAKDERKLYLSTLSKLYITSKADRADIQIVIDLVDDALASKIATDTTTRNTLTKFQTMVSKAQSTVSRSRATSRAPSIAPSVVEDDVTEFPQRPEPMASDETEDVDVSIAPTSAAPTPAASPRKSRGPMPFVIKEEPLEEEPTSTESPGNTQSALVELDQPRQRQGRTASMKAPPASSQETVLDTSVTDENSPNLVDPMDVVEETSVKKASSPTKDRRRTTMMVKETEEDSKVVVDSEDTTLMPPPPSPTKKARGRPSRASMAATPAAATEAPAKRAPRQSLRATRRAALLKEDPED